MAKTESRTYESLEDISISIHFNQKVGESEYVAAIVNVSMDRVDENGESERVVRSFEASARRQTEFTNLECYQLLGNAQVPPFLQAKLKEVANEAVGLDIAK